jgi:hypothetical protein
MTGEKYKLFCARSQRRMGLQPFLSAQRQHITQLSATRVVTRAGILMYFGATLSPRILSVSLAPLPVLLFARRFSLEIRREETPPARATDL